MSNKHSQIAGRRPSSETHAMRLMAWKIKRLARQREIGRQIVVATPPDPVAVGDEPGPPGGCIE